MTDPGQRSAILGALIYHLRRIFHDGSDDVLFAILRSTIQAMCPGWRILITDTVLPENRGTATYGFAGYQYDEFWRYGTDVTSMGGLAWRGRQRNSSCTTSSHYAISTHEVKI